ncbi:WG repeat-containing protein [Pedobacter changchengzhani]|nr:WG repeat-containing protein [Pedobacter changchengzhani]
MDEFKKQFKGKSIEEIKEILVDQNKQLSSMIKLSSLSIKITPGKLDPKESKTSEKFSTSPKNKIVSAFNEKFDKLYFRQEVIYPNTYLGLDFSASSIMYSVNDYDSYGFPKPSLKLKKVYFKDGKTENQDQDIAGRDSDVVNEIKGTKWIDSIQLEATYYYPDGLSFINVSEKNPSHVLNDGKVILVDIKGNEINLKLSEKIKDKIIKVEGINASGKSIEQSGSSSSNIGSNFSVAFLQAMYKTGEDAIAKIDKKEYQNVDELIKYLYQNMPKEDKEKPENLTNVSYSFRGNITAVNIFFKPKGAIENYSFTLKNQADYIDGFIISKNKKGLFGLLDDKGKWVVEPTFEQLDQYKSDYFMGDVGDDGYRKVLWLDRKSQNLIPFKYRFYKDGPYFNKYYFIEDGVNGPKGIVNFNTNEILLAPTYDNVSEDGNFLVLTTQDQKSVIVDENLKTIMTVDGYNYKIHGNYIFKEKPYTKKEKFADYITLSRTEDIYNSSGKKINKEDYVIDTYDNFGMDSLLLVKNKAGKQFFINTKGDVVIDASKYKDVQFFSNGLAAVKNQLGKWGYINPKGDVIIPFAYTDPGVFSKYSALVESATDYMLIDKNNKPIKKFADGFRVRGVGKDAETLKYTNYNGNTYGSKGEIIREK